MEDTSELKCPVCRARQTVRIECRRCGADLALYVQALRSLEFAEAQRADAAERGESDRVTRIGHYIRWLDPRDG
jgi:hypothetical protein